MINWYRALAEDSAIDLQLLDQIKRLKIRRLSIKFIMYLNFD